MSAMEGFRGARRAGLGTAAPRYWIGMLLAVEGAIVAVVALNMQGSASVGGEPSVVLAVVLSVVVGMAVALVALPVVALVMCGPLILRWVRAVPTWRRAAGGRPTRVLHADLVPGTRDVGKHAVRTVRVRTPDVLPVLHLHFARDRADRARPSRVDLLQGPATLELFAGHHVGGPVRVSTHQGAVWAFDVTAAQPEETPALEVEVELSGPPLDLDLERYSITFADPDKDRPKVPLSPMGDGFQSAHRIATRRTSPWRLASLAALFVLISAAWVAFIVAAGAGQAETTGLLDPRDPGDRAILLAFTPVPLIGLIHVRRQARRRRLIGPAWRRAAAGLPTLELTGTMLPGTRAVGRHGIRTVRLDPPAGREGEPPTRDLQLLFVTAEGWGERLTGRVSVQLFAGDLLRGPARVRDASRTEWALAARDHDDPVPDGRLDDTWNDDGWTDLDADGDGGGDGDGGE